LRLLLVSDLHYTLPQLDWVVRAAPRHDLVVVAGDCLDIASAVPLEVQTAVLLRYFALVRQGAPLAVGSGNHDLTGPDARGEQAALWLPAARDSGVAVDGDTLDLADLRVSVFPWWDGPLGRAAVEARMARESAQRVAHWVWVYHWPPLGSPTCWTGRRDYGDTELGGWIDRFAPDLVLTGHVHEPPFKPAGAWADRRGRTWIFNAGRQIGPVPAHIEIDLGAGRATWRSLMGEESLALDSAEAPPRSVF
jgi:predicted phosphodiesterase